MFKDQEQEKVDKDKASEKYELKIQMWATRGGKIKNNIKVLLCTLQDVLWPNCGWERVGMADIHNPNDVKKYYRKAALMFHPDKIQKLIDADKKFIASRCMSELNEAFS